ncbi:NAD-dependent deacylase [Gordonia sp. VNK21]|uniref:NAD-dependent deacylase n=1 Tax=Gordonia sp. VNK21 TaxID=3382483 RepID=UPI0038D4B237
MRDALDSALVERAAALLEAAGHVVVFTGAGMSAESGVPTFRDAMTGLWSRFSPEDLATPEAWERDRETVWRWYAGRAAAVREVAPNDGHRAVAELGDRLTSRGGALSVVTQNVDDLHERAGSEVAGHLHGSLFQPRCEVCDRPAGGELSVAPDLPHCELCDGPIRPGVVWFGEMLPAGAWRAAEQAFAAADVVLIVGTSGLVYPAASLPIEAAERGTPIIEVNPEPSTLTPTTDCFLPAAAGTALPALLRV